ncbi:hypothetical protein AB6A40_004506 [Gnathostoma spinigerum]|uniref:Protein phosphatase 1 regulatory subunit 21 n=1 Tax=Gnathostoma spinigerum TaxID=75299 RepID=A0ABD6EMK8_9BILA
MSTVSSTAEFSSKYQRIAVEYAKLRAQIPKLKEGVIDEKAKNKKLTEDLHARDCQLRRLERENESLQFRNDQLTKRVESLQEDVEKSRRSPLKKASIKPDQVLKDVENAKALLESELSKRLAENEELHLKVSELESAHEAEIGEVKNRYVSLKKERDALLAEVEACKMRNVGELTPNLRHFNDVKSPSPSTLSGEFSTSDDIRSLSETIDPQTLWSDTSRCVRFVFSNLSRLVQLLEQRSVIYPNDATMEQLTNTSIEFGRQLVKNGQEFKQASERMAVFTNDLAEGRIGDPSEQLKEIVPVLLLPLNGLQKWRESFDRSISEECRQRWCSSKLNDLNEEWSISFTKFLDLLSSIDFNFESDRRASLETLGSTIDHVALCCSVCSKTYSSKVVLENRIPTACKRLRCVNECIEKCLHSLSRSLLHCKAFVVAFLADMASTSKSCPISDERVCETRAEMIANTDLLDACVQTDEVTEDGTGVLKLETFKNSTVFSSSTDLESGNLKARIIELEKEKERIAVGAELLRMKLERLRRSSDDGSEDQPRADIEIVIDYYERRIEELLEQLQFIKSRAVYFEDECENLVMKTTLKLEENEKISQRLAEAEQQIATLSDDLETTRRNYEEQMKSLCEHIGELNAKLEKYSQIVPSLNGQSNGIVKSKEATHRLLFK